MPVYSEIYFSFLQISCLLTGEKESDDAGLGLDVDSHPRAAGHELDDSAETAGSLERGQVGLGALSGDLVDPLETGVFFRVDSLLTFVGLGLGGEQLVVVRGALVVVLLVLDHPRQTLGH